MISPESFDLASFLEAAKELKSTLEARNGEWKVFVDEMTELNSPKKKTVLSRLPEA